MRNKLFITSKKMPEYSNEKAPAYRLFKVCAAIKDKKIIKMIAMCGYDALFEDDKQGVVATNKKRVCLTSRRWVKNENTRRFLVHREKSKKLLSKYGEVVSGGLDNVDGIYNGVLCGRNGTEVIFYKKQEAKNE